MSAHLLVRPGDSWASVCQAFGKTPSALGELLAENPSLAPPKPLGVGSVPLPRLVPGTRLKLPASFSSSAQEKPPVFLGDAAATSAADAAFSVAANQGSVPDDPALRARFVAAVGDVATEYCLERSGPCSKPSVATHMTQFLVYLYTTYGVLASGPTFPFVAMDWSMPSKGWGFLDSQGGAVDWNYIFALSATAVSAAYVPNQVSLRSFQTPVQPWVDSLITRPVTSIASQAPASWGSTANQVAWSSYNPAIPYAFVPWGSLDWDRVSDPSSFQNEVMAAFNKVARAQGKDPPFPTPADLANYATVAAQFDVLLGAVTSKQAQNAYATALKVLQSKNVPLDQAKKITLPALLTTLGDLAVRYDQTVAQIASPARLKPVDDARIFTQRVLEASKPPIPQSLVAAKAFTLPQAEAALAAQNAMPFPGNRPPPRDFGGGGRPPPLGGKRPPTESAASLACRKQGLSISPDGLHCLDSSGARAGSDPPAGEGGGGASPPLTATDCAAVGKVLSADGLSCVDPAGKKPGPLTAADCTSTGKVLSADGLSCVDPAGKKPGPLTAADCTAMGKVLGPDGLTCIDPPKSIAGWLVGGGIVLTAATLFYLTVKGHPAPAPAHPTPTQHPRRR